MPERPERAFKSAIQIPISESDCLGAALVYVRVQSPSTSCLHEATQRNTVSFSDLRKPSLSFGPAAAAGQSGGTSESREARANPKSRIRGSVGGKRGLAHMPAPVMLALRSGGLAGPHNVMWASRIPGAATELLSRTKVTFLNSPNPIGLRFAKHVSTAHLPDFLKSNGADPMHQNHMLCPGWSCEQSRSRCGQDNIVTWAVTIPADSSQEYRWQLGTWISFRPIPKSNCKNLLP